MKINAGNLRLIDTKRQIISDYPLSGIIMTALLIFISPFTSPLFCYAALAICLYRMLRYDVRVFATDYAILIPLSAMFKGGTGMSLIVYLCLAAVAWYIFKNGIRADYSFLFLFFILVFLILRMQTDVADFLLCFGQLSLICIIFPKQDTKSAYRIADSFCISLIAASVFAFVFRGSSALRAVIGEESLAYTGATAVRFYGPFSDPNFYTTLLIIGFVLLIKLKELKKIKTWRFIVFTLLMLMFGILTYSKTFFLSLVLLFGIWIIWQFWDRKHLRGFLVILVLIPTSLVLIFAEGSPFAIVLTRLTGGSGISDFTTGRTDIFARYFEAIVSSPKHFLIGYGLSSSKLGMDPHNLFLEIAYYLGVVGLILFIAFFFALLNSFVKRSDFEETKNPVSKYVGIFMFIILYNTLHGLFAPVTYGGFFLACISVMLVKKKEEF